MAKGYAIFTEDITDADAMGAYAQAAVPTVIAAGGYPSWPARPTTSSKVHGTGIKP